MRLRTNIPAGLLLLGLLSAPMLSAQQALDKDRFRHLQEKFVCQCGCNYGLAVCPHLVCPSAPVMRDQIATGLKAEQSDEEIIKAMVVRFGQVALAQPSAEGFNLLAWVMPFIALLLGGFVLQYVMKSWRKRAIVASTGPPTSDPALLERYRDTIEREMQDLED